MTNRSRGQKILGAIAGTAVAVVLALALLEILLRIYNPIPFTAAGYHLRLDHNRTFHVQIPSTPKLDPVAIVRRNALGFRGPNPPPDLARRLSVVTVGGSTTECFFLSEGDTWPDQLRALLQPRFPGVWLDNAGVMGESSHGNLLLTQQYLEPLHPRIVLYLEGANELAMAQANAIDQMETGTGAAPPEPTWRRWLLHAADHSRVASLGVNLYRSWRSYQLKFYDQILDFRALPHLPLPSAPAMESMRHDEAPLLAAYDARLQALVDEARGHGMEPVLLTQPLLAGAGTDPATGIDLATVAVNWAGWHTVGAVAWQRLQWYNDVTREVAARNHVFLIDLAVELPKDSSLYYDFLHYDKAGAARVARIVNAQLAPWLAANATLNRH